VFPLTVLFLIVSVPWRVSPSPQFWMPAPPEVWSPKGRLFPETVERSTSIVPPALESPPPEDAVPPVIVSSRRVRLPALRTSPPLPGVVPPRRAKPWITTGSASAVTSKTRSPSGPRTVVVRAPAPLIVMALETTSAPKAAESR
jgi:hypothetical protein